MNDGEVYRRTEKLGAKTERGIERLVRKLGIKATVARQGSAFCLYFMDHSPSDWHDLAAHHDFEADNTMRRLLIGHGIYMFPLATKQCSISAAHSEADIEVTLQMMEKVLGDSVETCQDAISAAGQG